MQGKKWNILCTRTISKHLLEKACNNDVNITVIPFIKTLTTITTVTKDVINKLTDKNTVVFTSRNAVHAVSCINADFSCKVYCTSGATLLAIQKYLKRAQVIAVANDAAGLAETIIQNNCTEELIFFCGNLHLPVLPQLLENVGITLHKHIVYNTELTPRKINTNYDGIAFFSPSAVESFLSANTIRHSTTLFAIGNTTADSLRSLEKNVVISKVPTTEMLVDTIIDFYKNKQITVKG